MKKLLPFLIFCVLWMGEARGQGENNIWYFGNNSGLDFNSGSPVAISNGQTYTYEGTAIISDTLGNFLFYTDGVTVWNRNHLPMPNGFGLGGNFSSTQSATIVPIPGSSALYYIFTTPPDGFNGYFRHSIVDMTLDGGNGDITLKNIQLHANSSDKCVAIYKNSSPDIWVIGHSNDSIFYSYLVTSVGINPPVLSIHQTIGNSYAVGYMKASQQSNKIAAALYNSTPGNNSFTVYDFNCSNGNISNEKIISLNSYLYGLEFSPDGTRLYVFPWSLPPTPIYQYDVTLGTAAAIAASQIIVGYSNHGDVGGAQIGPDQKIYITINLNDSLSVINNPNLQGAACNFVDNAVYLGGGESRIGLPALIRGSVCNVTGIEDISSSMESFSIFPNPSNDELSVQSTSGIKSIEIFDVVGQKIPFKQPQTTSNNFSLTKIDVSNFPNGLYFITVDTENQKVVKKFVKN